MTVSSVGTGKTYTTWALWRAACPSNLTAGGSNDQWIGEQDNEELTLTAAVNFTGITTDSTHYIELRGRATQGWADSSANPLRYSTGGARVTCSSYGVELFTVTSGQKDVRFTNLQLRHTGVLGNNYVIRAVGAQIDRCIIESASCNNGNVLIDDSTGWIARSVITLRQSSGANGVISLGSSASIYSSILACTTVGGASAGLGTGYVGTETVRNCGIFGATAVAASPLSGTRTFTTCFTNVASPPSGCTTTALSTSSGAKFTNITDGTHDYKITSGSSMAGAGTTDSTFFPTDCFGTTAGSPPSVGPFELGGGGGAATSLLYRSPSARLSALLSF